MNVRTRRMALRAALCVALVAFGVWMVFVGKRHTLVFDNQELSRQGVVFPAVKGARVTAGGTVVEVDAEDRGAAEVIGMNHRIVFEICDERGSVVRKIDVPLRLRFEKTVILSLPLLSKGAPDFFLQE
jgi:hypothetical protein